MTHPTYVVEWPRELTAHDASLISEALRLYADDLADEAQRFSEYSAINSSDLLQHQAARCRSLARMFKTAAQPSH